MADIVRLERVEQLPDVPIIDTVYYVQSATGEVTEQWVVGNDGVPVRVSLSSQAIADEVVAEVTPPLAAAAAYAYAAADAAYAAIPPDPRVISGDTQAVKGDTLIVESSESIVVTVPPGETWWFTVFQPDIENPPPVLIAGGIFADPDISGFRGCTVRLFPVSNGTIAIQNLGYVYGSDA